MAKTLTFFSNYFNHHQKALCDELFKRLGEGFHFIETEPMEGFRSDMGWGREGIPSYVLKSYESDQNEDQANKLASDSDIVIMGTAPERYIKERLKNDRLIFRYSERPLKEGRWKIFVPYLTKKFYVNHISNRNKSIYCLCAGAFVSSDYRFLLNSYKDKCYKFGYFPFPEEKTWEELSAHKLQNNRVKILWCGRFLKLKRADLLIKACAAARDEGYDFDLELVGNGEEEQHLKKLTDELGLNDRTSFMGYMSPEDTRAEMEKADIYVCTSNKLEGWGAVIYEGLSAGCTVIATSMAGATPFLIRDRETGLVFRSGDEKSLARKLTACLKDMDTSRKMAKRAYMQMRDIWNPDIAAERILKVSEHLLKGESFYYDEGPMSEAPVIYEDWYRE
ncbi:MAG: glycosyltransferase [Lachnospiraceae bacterium]|nr:glycosyltransferase [Lachnospiraceae bacterium]